MLIETVMNPSLQDKWANSFPQENNGLTLVVFSPVP
jgi:hypothetical protein